MRLIALALSATALAGCSTVQNLTHSEPQLDATTAAILQAHPRECPNGRTLENARIGSDNDSRGVTVEDLITVPIANDPGHALRMRRIVVAPHGILAWHTHEEIQGAAILISGEMTEFRGDCLDPIRYRPGDIAREDAQTAHGWRNQTDEQAVIIVTHVVPR